MIKKARTKMKTFWIKKKQNSEHTVAKQFNEAFPVDEIKKHRVKRNSESPGNPLLVMFSPDPVCRLISSSLAEAGDDKMLTEEEREISANKGLECNDGKHYG